MSSFIEETTYPKTQRHLQVIILLILATSSVGMAQNMADKWYFGDHAAIDFSSGTPVALSNSAMHIFEGCASICDNQGGLLFYQNGKTIWDRNHTVMPNGTGLSGDTSSTQSLILQNPDSCNIYYVFTVGSHLTPNGGVWYSIVDMNLNGGLGDVVAGQKNIQLLNQSSEGIAAIHHSNAEDVWVITHELNSDNFKVFLVTASGVNSSVVSNIGPTRDLSTIIGLIKPSHSGTKIAMTITFSNPAIYVFDFDPATGIVSNPNNISNAFISVNGAYGIEFSPDDTVLYLTSIWGNSYLHQYDFVNGTTLVLEQSPGNYHYGSLQMAKDEKIYMARQGQSFISVINDPNISGTGCNFISNGVTLAAGSYSLFGLPNEPSYAYEIPQNDPCNLSSPVGWAASDTDICEKFCIDFFDSSANNPSSWLWHFEAGVPDFSTDQNPVAICYPVPGIYDVTLLTTSATGIDTLTLIDYITVNPTPPFPTITQNGNMLTSSPAVSYQWQLNSVDLPGATNQSYVAIQTGYYTVVAGDSNGCENSVTVYVDITGIDNLLYHDHLSIYPNPSSGVFIVKYESNESCEAVKLKVFNALGQDILSREEIIHADHFSETIDLGSLTAAVYFLEVTINNHISVNKLITKK